jgi:hypothetical protein
MPGMALFAASPEWKHYTFPCSTFATDGSDLTGLGCTHSREPGKFRFEIDQVQAK